MLGPVLVALIVLIAWLDESVEGLPISVFWQRVLLQERPAVPPGAIIFLLAIVLSVLASRELARILKSKGILASKRITTAASVTGLLVSTIVPVSVRGPTAVAIVSSASVGVLVTSLLYYSRKRSFEGVVAAAGGALLSFVYLGLMFGFLLAIRREHSVWVLLWIILVTKSSDIGAFATGKTIGRHKLIPWLSPGKTWEGLVGGTVFAGLFGAVGLLLLHQLPGERLPPVWTGVIAGVLFGLTGQAGDLIASLFKRDAGFKDSSAVLPGFGGVLDVLDSPLLVAPVAYWWMMAVGAG
jgi:phosphatidate cytidylyltransferase